MDLSFSEGHGIISCLSLGRQQLNVTYNKAFPSIMSGSFFGNPYPNGIIDDFAIFQGDMSPYINSFQTMEQVLGPAVCHALWACIAAIIFLANAPITPCHFLEVLLSSLIVNAIQVDTQA